MLGAIPVTARSAATQVAWLESGCRYGTARMRGQVGLEGRHDLMSYVYSCLDRGHVPVMSCQQGSQVGSHHRATLGHKKPA